MTIRTTNLALRNLFLNRFYAMPENHVCNVIFLFSYMIKFQDNRVTLPTINTWMLSQIINNELSVFSSAQIPSSRDYGFVML
jgi:hypothetical protein